MSNNSTTNRYDKYKDSGIEWIGEIPDSWNNVRLRFLCNIQTGNKDTVDKNEYGEYPFYVRSPIIERIDTYSFDGEAILTAGDGVGAGKVFHYVKGKFDYHQRVYNLHNFNKICAKFLFYYLKENFYKEIEQSNAKSTVDSIRLPMLLDFPVVFAKDFNEQEAIAGYLDKKCGAIDETIEKQRSAIEKLKEYKQSIITQAVTKGLDKSAPMKDSGIEWIGQIPQHWEISKIKFSAIVNPKYNENLSSDTLVSFAPMECLTNCNLECKDAILSNVLGSYTYFANNDIIMAKVTPCFENGNIALATNLNNGVGFGSSELYVFRSINIFDKFLLYLLQNTQFKDNAIATMYGTGGLKRVSIEFVKNYKFACPDLKEQEQIAAFLDKKCSEIDKTIEDKEKLIEKLVEYKKSLIYECVTGKRKVI